ncbi:unnamed protein product, partial [Chrysoparadoxa australica]
MFQDLSGQVGVDVGTVKYVCCMFATYPLGFLFSRLPLGVSVKHFISLFIGAWFMQFIFYAQWIHSFAAITGSYLMILVLPKQMMPYAVMTFVMVYIALSHLYRMYVDYMGWSLDFTGPQMILVMKLSSMAFNIYDGRKLDKLQDTGDKRKDKVLATRRKYALDNVPGPLAFYGYCYNFSTILTGPTFEFSEYVGAISRSAYLKAYGTSDMPSGNLAAMFTNLFVGLVMLGIHQTLGPMFPLSDLYSPAHLAMSIPERWVRAWVALWGCKAKYYFAWKVAEGGANAAGFGFTGYDKEGKSTGWGGVCNMDIWAFETAQNFQTSARAWNKGTQGWLERYVYIRTGNSLVAVYSTSAVWHGFYPGYYLFFLSLPLATSAARAARKKLRPYFMNDDGVTPGQLKPAYDLASLFVTNTFINYLV